MKINVKVKPNSRIEKIIKMTDSDYEIYLKEKAENNKANKELVKLLKKEFKKDVKIVSGSKSKRKVIELI